MLANVSVETYIKLLQNTTLKNYTVKITGKYGNKNPYKN